MYFAHIYAFPGYSFYGCASLNGVEIVFFTKYVLVHNSERGTIVLIVTCVYPVIKYPL